MACFDLHHQYQVQPLFVDSSLAARRYAVAATQVMCCNYCVHQSRPQVSFVKVFFFSVVVVLDTVRTCAFGGQGWSGPKCIAVLFLHIAEACLKIGFYLTAPIGWCGRLSVHESSYMDPRWSWSFLMVTRHPAIYTLIPCTIQKYVLLHCG